MGPNGRLTVADSRLYDLVDLPAKDRGEHVFEIDFEGPGAALYAFTFG